MRLAPDGLREIVIATIVFGGGAAVSAWAALSVSGWFWMLAVPLAALWGFCLAFFRDPDRTVPNARGLMVAPADGKVTEVANVEHDEEIGGPAIKISIFLSVFNVHVNRTSCGGRVLKTDYHPGEFLDARHPECGIRNERNTIVIEPDGGIRGPIVIRQIAGLIARRIICNVGPGDTLERGQRIGLIKFGSRTDLLVPVESGLEPAVRVNDHIKGGSTVLMRPAKVGAAAGEADDRRLVESTTGK